MKLVLKKNKPTSNVKLKCKACKKELDHRIPRAAIIKILFPWLHLKHYKCTNCMRTTYRIAN
ncbi:MAG: hypothetical protein EAZ51_04025 [Sphingobacteriales bacterium]|nr:MAG: hypothetical protein EAZ64_03800 [Sphingobacteriales bacterium]TAF81547.1 MAG: hypothetical protein EAZ51_04025 [Sphingobacteriales bacterium]